VYRLTPPTESYKTGSDSLWGRIAHTRGLALVVYTDGRVVTTASCPSTSEEGVDKVWPGGRVFEISDADAATLTAAGYSSCLELVA
jgi:hypothetical protein